MKSMHFTGKDKSKLIIKNGFNLSKNSEIKPQWLGNGAYFYPCYFNGTYNEIAHNQGIGLALRHYPAHERRNVEVVRITLTLPVEKLVTMDLSKKEHFDVFDNYVRESFKVSTNKTSKYSLEKYDEMLEIMRNKEPFSKHKEKFGFLLGSLVDDMIDDLKQEHRIDLIVFGFIPGRGEYRKEEHAFYGEIGINVINEICVKNKAILHSINDYNVKTVNHL